MTTARKRAEAAVGRIHLTGRSLESVTEYLIGEFEKHAADAVRQERERCAKIAEGVKGDDGETDLFAGIAADRIRAAREEEK